jgi:hypothetical protein
LRVPLVFQGTGVEELNIGGHWSEVDIAPTVLSILNISSNFTTEGKILPIRERYDLQIVGAPGGVELWQGNKTLANAAGDKEYNFRGLALGCYTLKSGKRSWDVLVSGDMTMDLAGTGPSVLPGSTKKIVGVIIIMAINIAGLLVIIRIIRREK